MKKGEKYKGVDIGAWKYDGPKDFVKKLIDEFGPPYYIEKNPDTCEAESATFKNIDGFDLVRIVDSNTNKLHPYPAKIYVEGSMYFPVPKSMVGALKMASPTIMIDELNQLVTGKCASLSIAAATVQFVIDAVNGVSPPTREEYDIIAWDMDPGDVIAFHGMTVHGAGGNYRDDIRRRGYTVRYTGADAWYDPRPGTAQPLISPDLKNGDPMNNDLFPVVWTQRI